MTERVTIAGRTRTASQAAAVLVEYARKHPKTLRTFDGPPSAGANPALIDEQGVIGTRIVSSRISGDEVRWFVHHSQGAPWDLIEGVHDLAEIDACRADSRWDDVLAFYRYFRNGAPSGVAVSKIHKVLHRVRPGLFPILDSRLQKLYRPEARVWAAHVAVCRPDLPAVSHHFWMAIRSDLLTSQSALDVARAEAVIALSDSPDLAEIVEGLSPLRLLDIISWKLAS